MKFRKKVAAVLMAVAVAVTSVGVPESSVEHASAAGDFVDLDQAQMTEEMGAGWNLGNQLEAANNGQVAETNWGNPVITENLIKAVKAAGFRSIRIPVSYMNKIGSDEAYTIDAAWLDRVQQVVDMCMAQGLYAIINMHGDGYTTLDGGWLFCAASDQTVIRQKYQACWKQIAARFKDYDEHLIFESMNEEFDGTYGNPSATAYANINAYNQIFVDTVRQTGGNNDRRWLMIPGWNTNINYTADNYGFQLPTDHYLADRLASGEKRIMISVHYYDPWDFCGTESGEVTQWGDTVTDSSKEASWGNESYLNTQFQKMYRTFVQKGYPVVIGEYGSIDKSEFDSANTVNRAEFAGKVCAYAQKYNMIPVCWDNGHNGKYGFGLFDRYTYQVTQPEIIRAIMQVYGKTATESPAVTNTAAPTSTPEGTDTTEEPRETTEPAEGAMHVRLYLQETSGWKSLSSEKNAALQKTGETFCLSVNATDVQLGNIGSLYLKEEEEDGSKISYVQIQLDALKVNGKSYAFKQNTYTYDAAAGDSQQKNVFDFSLINVWSDITTYIENVTVDAENYRASFDDVAYQGNNTVEIQFHVNAIAGDAVSDPTPTASVEPTVTPSAAPSEMPSVTPGIASSDIPSQTPGTTSAGSPSVTPSAAPSEMPSATPGNVPSETPLQTPGTMPSALPSWMPEKTASAPVETVKPTVTPVVAASEEPADTPMVTASAKPNNTPGVTATVKSDNTPSVTATVQPSSVPTVKPTATASSSPTVSPCTSNVPGDKENSLSVGTMLTEPSTGVIYRVTNAGIIRNGKVTGAQVEYVRAGSTKQTQKVPDAVAIRNVTYRVTSIASGAFSGSSVTNIVIGKNVNQIKTKAFYMCTSLRSIVIPKSVKKIGAKAFYNCINLQKITIRTTALTDKRIGAKAFSRIGKRAVIKVPGKKYKAYKKLLRKKGSPKTVRYRK